MKRLVRLGALLALVSCGGGETRAPKNLDDACSILDQRPRYVRALADVNDDWDIPPNVVMAVIYQESKFISNAKTPHEYALGIIPTGRQSSAYGYSQAIDGTWDDYRDATGKRGARRNQFDDAVDFMGWYMNEAVAELGISRYDAEQLYLAYHDGINGYRRGTHRDKAWLIRVADEVGQRSELYQAQLIACGKF